MAKISNYPENTNPDPEMFIAIEPVTHDQKYKTPIGNLSIFPIRNKMNKQIQEFDAEFQTIADGISPFTAVAISTGTLVGFTQEANHPGIYQFQSSALANSGYVVGLGGASAVLIGGSEVGEFIFRLPTVASQLIRLGFFDTVSAAAPLDQAQIIIQGTTLDGRTASNGTTSITSTTFTVAAATWYRARVEVNAAATLVTFTLYNAAGTVLWTDTLSTNIPTAAGRETGFGALALKTTVTAANLLDLDWMNYSNTKALVR